MAEWLSEQWLDGLAQLSTSLPPAGTASGSVDLAIATAPRREVHVHWTYQDGQAVAGSSGPAAVQPDLALSLSAEDAASVLSGSVEPSVAFMRGRLKASGDGKLLMAVLESTHTAGYALWREQVGALGTPG